MGRHIYMGRGQTHQQLAVTGVAPWWRFALASRSSIYARSWLKACSSLMVYTLSGGF